MSKPHLIIQRGDPDIVCLISDKGETLVRYSLVDGNFTLLDGPEAGTATHTLSDVDAERAATVRWLEKMANIYSEQADRQSTDPTYDNETWRELEVEASSAQANAYHHAARHIGRGSHRTEEP